MKQKYNCIKFFTVKMMHESQWLLVAAAVKCISMIGKMAVIPNVEVEILVPVAGDKNDDDDNIEYESKLR